MTDTGKSFRVLFLILLAGESCAASEAEACAPCNILPYILAIFLLLVLSGFLYFKYLEACKQRDRMERDKIEVMREIVRINDTLDAERRKISEERKVVESGLKDLTSKWSEVKEEWDRIEAGRKHLKKTEEELHSKMAAGSIAGKEGAAVEENLDAIERNLREIENIKMRREKDLEELGIEKKMLAEEWKRLEKEKGILKGHMDSLNKSWGDIKKTKKEAREQKDAVEKDRGMIEAEKKKLREDKKLIEKDLKEIEGLWEEIEKNLNKASKR